MPSSSTRPAPSLASTVAATLSFPWQGAVLIAALTLGAAVRQHPGSLRPVVHTAQAAALILTR